MNKVSDRNKRTLIIVGLCAVLIFMAVGYAAFSQMLRINGTSSISSNWCLGFDNTKLDTFTPTKGVETGTSPSGEIVYSGTACGSKYVPTATLNTTLNQPGDKVEYTLTIKNAGSINAAIKSITVDGDSVTSNTTKTKGNVKYIVEMPETTTLAKGAETTMKVTVSFQDDTDITGSYSGERQSMHILINAEEDDGNGGMDITPASQIVYLYPEDPYSIGDVLETAGVSNYTDLNSYQNGKSWFLKYELDVNNVIKNMWACQKFQMINEPICAQGGNSSYYQNNYEVFNFVSNNEEFINNGGKCNFQDNYVDCTADYSDLNNALHIQAYKNGHVISVFGYSLAYCSITDNGASICRG